MKGGRRPNINQSNKMKKLLFAAAFVLAGFAMVSCDSNSVETKASEYAQQISDAMLSGDMEKAEQIQQECDEWFATLSEEDQAKAEKAAEEIAAKMEEQIKEKMEEQLQQAEGAVEEAAEEAVEDAADAVEYAIEEVVE